MDKKELLPYQLFRNFDDKKNLKASLLIAFYQNWNFLKMVLTSAEMQSTSEFEVIICDDGSDSKVTEMLHQYMRESSLKMKHIWHRDDGFRKNESLNKGIINSDSNQIIFIDQDCILHPHFIEEHILHSYPNTILAGRRLELSPWITQILNPGLIKDAFIQKNLWWIILTNIFRKDNQGHKGIYIKNKLIRKLINNKNRGVVGCNFSVGIHDLLKVNGFDMRYQGPGTGEDSDIEWRLNQNGVATQLVLNIAVQYHLFHPLQKRKNQNEALFKEVQQNKRYFTTYGISMIDQSTPIDL